MGKCFDQVDVFPVIAEIIHRLHAANAGYATHEQIVAALLADPLGSALIERGRQNCPALTQHALASNMVQWFSQSITVAQSPYRDAFDRRQIAKAWAYKPVRGVTRA